MHCALPIVIIALCGIAPDRHSQKEVLPQTQIQTIKATPSKIVLDGQRDRFQLLVEAQTEDGTYDLTRQVQWSQTPKGHVSIDEHGRLTPLANGAAELVASFGGKQTKINIEVQNADSASAVDFDQDVQAVLTRFGCNQGACHGKQNGQNGFQLSLFGFDSNFDYDALTKEARGRRVFPAAPKQSLLLQKPIVKVPHGGGKLLKEDSPAYAILLQWIEAGLPRTTDQPRFEKITIYPPSRTLKNKQQQQMQVTAHYEDGSTRDVTHLAAFQSSESAIVKVSEEGLVEAGIVTGDAAIMARFLGEIAICAVDIPLPGELSPEYYKELPRNNFIDDLVWQKLQRLNLAPSPLADDTTFLRRVHLDIIGRIPTPEEVRAFLQDESKDKRAQVVRSLLQRPEYADYWANKWMDLLRPNPYRVGIKAVFNLDAWVRDAFRQNMPYDQFVREIVTAQGSTFHDNSPVTVFRDRRAPDEIATMVSQLFLGIRLECAKCHHHPFEIWGQDDFYSFAAYFSRLGRKGRGLSPPISGSEEVVFTSKSGSVKHPLTGEVLPPRPLFGEVENQPSDDPRAELAAWMTSKTNPFFAQVAVNRVWADLMGRGIVDPVDDLRGTNPASNQELLDALADHFRENDFDLKRLIELITTSHVYQLSSEATPKNSVDNRNYSRHYRQRLRAEILLDAICDITGVPESFSAMPPQSRAMELWTHRSSSLFLDAFGRPDPNQDPPCERLEESSVVQSLHLMNAPNLHRKFVSDSGRIAGWVKSDLPNDKIVDEIYLWCFARFPSEEEKKLALTLFAEDEKSKRRGLEDLLWALLNTAEFVIKN